MVPGPLRRRPSWTSLSRHSSRSRQRARPAQAGSPAARKSSSVGRQPPGRRQPRNHLAVQPGQLYRFQPVVGKGLPHQRKQRADNLLADRLGVLANLPLGVRVHPQVQEVQQIVQIDLPVRLGIGRSGRSLRACSRATPSSSRCWYTCRACSCSSASAAESSAPAAGSRKPSLPWRLCGGLQPPAVGRGGLRGVDGDRIARAGLVDRGHAVPNPLPPAVHRHADQQFHLGHLEGRGVPVPHQVADQRAIVGDVPRAGRVAHPGRLDHRMIVAHHVDQADESVVEDGKLCQRSWSSGSGSG